MKNNRFFRKTTMILTAAAVASMLLAGCGKTDSKEDNKDAEPTAAITQSAAPGVVTYEKIDITDSDYITSLMDYKTYTYAAYSDSLEGVDGKAYYEAYTNQYITQGREEYAKDDAKSGVAANGDTVVISYVATLDGEPYMALSADLKGFEIGSKTINETLENSVIGHQPGEEYEVVVTYPENFSLIEEVAGKDVTYKVTFDYYAVKIAVTLENAYSLVYGYETYEDCIADMDAYVQETKEQNKADYESGLTINYLNVIVTNTDFVDLTAEIDEYFETYYAAEEKYYGDMGYDMEIVAGYYGCESVDALKETMKNYAEYTIKSNHVLNYIAERESIPYGDEEYKAFAEDMIADTGMELDKYAAQYDDYYGEGTFEQVVFNEYVIKYIFDKYAQVLE